jgi:hypothetical protein
MKVLIVGSNNQSAIERFYMKYLQQYGATVFHYDAYDIVFAYHSKNILNKILFKTKIKTGYAGVNKGLLEMAAKVKPDIIWVFKGMEIYPATLVTLKQQGFKLANYNPDHPFIIAGSGSGNKNVTDSVGLYDLHFCYHNDLQKEIEERFSIPTVSLPFAYESTEVVYTDPAAIKPVNKVCFQANPDAYRAETIALLAKNGFEVDVYGIGWQRTTLPGVPGVTICDIATREQFWKMNQSYRVQLNLFRKHNFGSHNMRTFEIPVVGGIELTPYSEEQAGFFEEGREIFFFRDNDEMIGRVKQIMDMSEAQANAVRVAARQRSLSSGYSFADRAQTVFNTFKRLL